MGRRHSRPWPEGGEGMEDFKEMYVKLYDKVTIAINNLQWALLEGEDKYIGNQDPHIIELLYDERKED